MCDNAEPVQDDSEEGKPPLTEADIEIMATMEQLRQENIRLKSKIELYNELKPVLEKPKSPEPDPVGDVMNSLKRRGWQ